MCQFAWNWTHFNPESLVTQGTLSPREAGIACHFGTKWGPKVDPATSKMHVHWSPWILLKSLLSLFCPQRKRKGLHYDHESIKRTYASTGEDTWQQAGAVQMDFQEGWMSCAAKYTHINWCHTPEMQAVWKYMAKVLGWVDAALILFPF